MTLAAAVAAVDQWAGQRRRRCPALPVPGRKIIAAGRGIWVRESGPANDSQPPVVLLTGAGDQAISWELVRRALSESIRVVGYDRMGMGGTDDGPDRRTLAGFVDELAVVLAAAQINGPVILVGHSFGGLIAQAYAATQPNRVAGLVLVDAVAPGMTRSRIVRTSVAINVAVARFFTAMSPLGLTKALFTVHLMPLYPEQHLLQAAATAPEYRRWVCAMSRGFAGNAAWEVAAVLPGAVEFPRPAADFLGPVTVIHSRLLGATWVALQEDLAACYPASIRIDTGDRFHNIHFSHPDLIIDAVRDQLVTLRV